MASRKAALLLFGAVVGCTTDAPVPPVVAGPPELHRLTERQVNNALSELFGASDLPAVRLPAEIEVDGFDNDASTRAPTPYLVESVQRELSAVAAHAVAEGGPWLRCAPGGGAEPGRCGEETLGELLPRAWRRPVTDAERAWVLDAFGGWEEELGFDAALTLALSVVLQSPEFLYLIEVGDLATLVDGAVSLTDWELASRMSFLLWDSMPDSALFQAAADGRLRTDQGVRDEAMRMFQDPKSEAAVLAFHRQWLDEDAIQRINPDYAALGSVLLNDAEKDYFDEVLESGSLQDIIELDEYWGVIKGELMLSYQAEMDLFLRHAVYERGTLDALLTSRRGFVSSRTAPLYGFDYGALDGAVQSWEPIDSDAAEGLGEFLSASVKQVEHDPERRAGVLTQGAFLAGHSHPTSTSPVLRGYFIRKRMLCLPPLVPPGDIPALGEVEASTWTTNRERYAAHSSDPACASCHVSIDGMGFPFEHYDAVGGWQDTDNGAPVDASGALVGTDVDGPVQDAIDVVEALAGSRMVYDCAVEKLWHYAMHRKPSQEDAPALAGLQDDFWTDGGVIPTLYLRLIESPAFRRRPLRLEGGAL